MVQFITIVCLFFICLFSGMDQFITIVYCCLFFYLLIARYGSVDQLLFIVYLFISRYGSVEGYLSSIGFTESEQNRLKQILSQ